jgi:hypothetical protein
MATETHGGDAGWDGRRRTYQAGDVIINLVPHFVPHRKKQTEEQHGLIC